MTNETMQALRIKFQEPWVDCGICGTPTQWGQGVPTYNGDIMSNDFPDDLWHQGGGSKPACKVCYSKHAAGRIKTWDRLYIQRGPFGVELVDGGGI